MPTQVQLSTPDWLRPFGQGAEDLSGPERRDVRRRIHTETPVVSEMPLGPGSLMAIAGIMPALFGGAKYLPKAGAVVRRIPEVLKGLVQTGTSSSVGPRTVMRFPHNESRREFWTRWLQQTLDTEEIAREFGDVATREQEEAYWGAQDRLQRLGEEVAGELELDYPDLPQVTSVTYGPDEEVDVDWLATELAYGDYEPTSRPAHGHTQGNYADDWVVEDVLPDPRMVELDDDVRITGDIGHDLRTAQRDAYDDFVLDDWPSDKTLDARDERYRELREKAGSYPVGQTVERGRFGRLSRRPRRGARHGWLAELQTAGQIQYEKLIAALAEKATEELGRHVPEEEIRRGLEEFTGIEGVWDEKVKPFLQRWSREKSENVRRRGK
jgi:hypothetical protein